MNFGVFVRSVGERTEQLCLESCYQCFPKERVHLLKNYYPSYNVYRAMFTEASRKGYNWFFGLDADILLMPNWFEVVSRKIADAQANSNFYKFVFRCTDKFLPESLPYFGHVYNGRFSRFARNALIKNIWISRLESWGIRTKVSPGFYLKPETAIRTRLKHQFGIMDAEYDDLIAWHGFEQYYCHIFHRFTIRANRNPEFEKKYPFLRAEAAEELRGREDKDWYVANLGWHYGKMNRIYKVDARNIEKYKIILRKEGITEKAPISVTLQDVIRRFPS